ncbi:hypothetical protein EV700_1116 [Fluviicoccus keumensis]|uniref:HNH endonuclease n=1 Tax=Fluviicoccus keumensis TaxID=1435465 RepID=A0A4Q7ZA22_9GAMM|nr:hypothetical protein [Fluviicoccus keumensis]RZU46735.1 hypothetical protein EV700_1116 [Fluviicoccus keumensis]
MVSYRDDFKQKTKQILAQRAAYRCSNPSCRVGTVGPHVDPNKIVMTGAAAHIYAAAEGGPRYNPEQSSMERAAITNGIWLCRSCADKIDDDDVRYPAKLLKKWKDEHEKWVRDEDFLPSLPKVTVETLHGLSIPSGPQTISGFEVAKYREHLVRISCESRHEVLSLQAHIQFPESIVDYSNLGVPVNLSIPESDYRVVASEGASVSFNGPMSAGIHIKIMADHLRPNSDILIKIRTEIGKSSIVFREMRELTSESEYNCDSDKNFDWYVYGCYLYRDAGQLFPVDFVSGIIERSDRNYSALPAQPAEEVSISVVSFLG